MRLVHFRFLTLAANCLQDPYFNQISAFIDAAETRSDSGATGASDGIHSTFDDSTKTYALSVFNALVFRELLLIMTFIQIVGDSRSLRAVTQDEATGCEDVISPSGIF